MSTATLTMSVSAAPTADAAVKPARKSWPKRFLDAMIEARMRQARRELARYLAVVPQDELKQAGLRVGLKDDAALPFTR